MTRSSPTGRLLEGLPVLAALVACASYWFVTGVALTEIAVFGLAWAWVVWVPGFVISRAIWGRARLFVADIAIASGVGIVTSTLVWLVLLAFGGQGLILAWPLLTAPLLYFRRAAVLDRRPYEHRLGLLASLALTAVLLAVVGTLARSFFATSPLPEGDITWYADTFWHLGLVAELGRSMPPFDPQVFGEPFWYHWFANAHAASLAGASGLDPILVFLRLWQPAVLLTVLGLLVAASDVATRRAWPGVVAGVLAFSYGVDFTWFGLPGLNSSSIPLSPSHQFALVPMMLIVLAVAELLRTRRRGAPIALFAVGTLGLIGGKASTLPVMICGLLAVIVLSWFTERALARWLAAMLGIAVAGFTTSMIATAAANEGGAVQLFSSVGITRPWRILMEGRGVGYDVPLVLPGLELRGAGTLLVLILASYVVMAGAAWLGLPLLRRDLLAWFLLAVGFAGFAALMLVKAGGESQQYFMRGALPAWALLGGLAAWTAWRRAVTAGGRNVGVLWVLVGLGTGRLIASAASTSASSSPEATGLNAAVATPILAFVLPVVVTAALVWIVDRRLVWLVAAVQLIGAQDLLLAPLSGLTDPGSAADIAAAALTAVGTAGILAMGRRGWEPRGAIRGTAAALLGLALLLSLAGGLTATRNRMDSELSGVTVTAAQVDASQWVREHTDPDALLATNVHCADPPERPRCNLQGFWPAGLTGRRMLLGTWSYTPEAHRRHGEGGLSSRTLPFHDAELYELNQRAFIDPTPEVLDALRDRGVDVLFGVRAYTDVSPELDALATELYRNDEVVVYSLPDQPS